MGDKPGLIAAEMARLQGVWKQVGYELDGVTLPADENGSHPRVAFTGDQFVVTLADGSVPFSGTYRLDPTTDPKSVDWLETRGDDAGKTIPAIYTLEGDRFAFCAADPGQARPTEFRTRPGQVLRTSVRQ